jgi:hypothetical protein
MKHEDLNITHDEDHSGIRIDGNYTALVFYVKEAESEASVIFK